MFLGFLLFLIFIFTNFELKAEIGHAEKKMIVDEKQISECKMDFKEFILDVYLLDINNRTNVNYLKDQCHRLTHCLISSNSIETESNHKIKLEALENCCEILDNAGTWFEIFLERRDRDWENLSNEINKKRNEKCDLEALGFPWILLQPGLCSFD